MRRRRSSSLESDVPPDFSAYVDLPDPGNPTRTTTLGSILLDDVFFGMNQPRRDLAPQSDYVHRLILREPFEHGEIRAERVAFGARGKHGTRGRLNGVHSLAAEHGDHV